MAKDTKKETLKAGADKPSPEKTASVQGTPDDDTDETPDEPAPRPAPMTGKTLVAGTEPFPTVGRIVHVYDRHHFGPEPLAAVVTRAGPNSNLIDCCAFVHDGNGTRAYPRIHKFDSSKTVGGAWWKWPERN